MITDEVRVRLTQLRDAAENLQTAAENIENAVQTTNGIVESLMARGFVSPAATAFHTNFMSKTTWMDEWPVHVRHVARLLEEAAEALGQAAEAAGTGHGTGTADPTDPGMEDHGGDGSGTGTGTTDPVDPGTGDQGDGGAPIPTPTGGTGGIPPIPPPAPGGTGGGSQGTGGSGSGDHETSETDEPETPPEPAPLEAYMSGPNRQLYDQIGESQEQIVTEQENLDYLQMRRQAVEEQLNDLTARLEEAGGNTDNARVQALRDEIATIDGEIANSETRITDLQTHISDIQTRLELVRPGAGADLDLIASLEGTRTIDAILNATRQADNSINCVNWVCTRMPIPPGIPGNAMTWIDNAMARPELGITVGSTPLAGSVIVMQPDHSFANDQFGHVMYVERVENGMIWVTDNNNHTPRLLQDLTDELTGPNIQYMYFPWQTQG